MRDPNHSLLAMQGGVLGSQNRERAIDGLRGEAWGGRQVSRLDPLNVSQRLVQKLANLAGPRL